MLIKAKNVPIGGTFVMRDKKTVCTRILTPEQEELSQNSEFGACIACLKMGNSDYYSWVLAEDEVFYNSNWTKKT